MGDDLARLKDAAKIAIDACRQRWIKTGLDVGSAVNNEKNRQKANFAACHGGWPDAKKRAFNDAWANRSGFPPHVPGSPRVFKDV
jgi:hypothetical protein